MLNIHNKNNPCDIIIKACKHIKNNSEILDLACGNGHNGRFLLELGHNLTFIDRDTSYLSNLKNVEIITTDLENNDKWPLGKRQFDAVLVINYLYRPIFKNILNSVKSGGYLIYETFAIGNEIYGKPSNPNFLLDVDELRMVEKYDFEIIKYNHGLVKIPKTAIKQSIIARKK